MKIEIVHSDFAPKAVGPYVQANKVGELIFCSGQLGLNPETGKLVEGGVAEEAKQSLKNLSEVLKAAGSDMEHVVKTTVLLTDIKDFSVVNEAYKAEFSHTLPARSAFQVAALPLGGKVEIELIAVQK